MDEKIWSFTATVAGLLAAKGIEPREPLYKEGGEFHCLVRLNTYEDGFPTPVRATIDLTLMIHRFDPALQGNRWENFTILKRTSWHLQQFHKQGFTTNIVGYKAPTDAEPEFNASLIIAKDEDEKFISYIIVGAVAKQKDLA